MSGKIRASIGEIAPTGEGVAIVLVQGERRAVLVRSGAPGDDLSLAVDFSRRPARGRILEVLRPGPARVAPACDVAWRCGGCDYMHLTRDAQRAAHEAHVRAALRDEVPIEVVRAVHAEHYRSRARLHARASGGRAVVGFFAAESHEPVEARMCLVLDERLDRSRAAVSALLEGAVGEGEALLGLGAFPEPRKPVVSITWPRELPAAVFGRAERSVADGTWAGVRLVSGETTRPAIIGDPTPWIHGADGEPLELSSAGFAQASEEMNSRLAVAVAQAVGDSPRILELYAGAGNFTVLLARTARKLTAVEHEAASCAAAQRNLARRSLRATVARSDASRTPIPAAVDAVVLDPPRAGAALQAEALARSHVRRVVYVSCDTRTLARDLATLRPTYTIERVMAFEMFPHTSHVETLVVLARKRG